MDPTNLRTVSLNGNGKMAAPATGAQSNGALQKVPKRRVRYLIPASSVQAPIQGHDIIAVAQQSVSGIPAVIAHVKEILRGVEADVRMVNTITIIEEPNKRTFSQQTKFRMTKDR